MKCRTGTAGLLVILALTLPGAPTGAEETPATSAEGQTQETVATMTEEDRQVVEMLDLLEILELLNEFDNVTALEEKP